jgi:hypothetical protein
MMNVPRISGRQLDTNTRATGSFATSPESTTFWNAGVSMSLRRT